MDEGMIGTISLLSRERGGYVGLGRALEGLTRGQ